MTLPFLTSHLLLWVSSWYRRILGICRWSTFRNASLAFGFRAVPHSVLECWHRGRGSDGAANSSFHGCVFSRSGTMRILHDFPCAWETHTLIYRRAPSCQIQCLPTRRSSDHATPHRV